MRKTLIPFLTAGFPEKAWFESLVKAMDNNGADYIEIGIPFSDPIADGPTIQAASQRALDNGVSCQWVLDEIKRFRGDLKSKLIFFSYYNPLQSLGADLMEAAQKLKEAGFHGVLVPDLALEEAANLIKALQAADLHYIPLIAPTTEEARLQFIAPYTTSFAYGVSVTGVTGARQGVAAGLEEYLERVRKHFKEFVVGFGISTPEDAARISQIADGVVIGSAIIRLLEGAEDEASAAASVGNFLEGIRNALDGG